MRVEVSEEEGVDGRESGTDSSAFFAKVVSATPAEYE